MPLDLSTSENRAILRERSREYKRKNRDKILARRRELYQENLEKGRAYYRERYARIKHSLPPRPAEYFAEWRKKNPEADKLIRKKYRDNNKEVSRAWVRRRRARKAGNGGSHTASEIIDLMAAQNGLCAICETDILTEYHADHIMPIALGGDDFISNIQLLCPTCNRQKGAKHPDAFPKRKDG